MSGHSYTIYVESEDPKEDGWDEVDTISIDIIKELKGHGCDVSMTYRGTYGC